MKYLIYTLCLFLPVLVVQSTPLYIEKVKLSTADEQKLQEVNKQIKNHSVTHVTRIHRIAQMSGKEAFSTCIVVI